ncbi:MAG: Ig-like domain-containing protein [Synergistaceae bacterium]|nr:Ig-like domain-containing protein [Synergistaceae bacterium]
MRNLTVSGDINVGGEDWTLYAGGVAGNNDGGRITNCLNVGAVTASGGYNSVGGVAGNNGGGTITNCLNVGAVTDSSSGESCAGGVAGNNGRGRITNCLNVGAVTASGSSNNIAGGVAGANFYGAITNCANNGAVIASGGGQNIAGGVAGANSGTITNCASAGVVRASGGSDNYPGGVAGRSYGTITNCGWLNNTASAGVGSDGGSSSAVSFDSTNNIVTTVLISSRDLTISSNGALSPVFVCYPGSSMAAAGMDSYFRVNSSDCAIASLDAAAWPGRLTGIATGRAPLTVSAVIYATNFAATNLAPITTPLSADLSCAVTVNGVAVDSVTVSCDKTELEIGRTADLTAIVSPDNATFPTVTWSVSGDAVTLSATSGDSVTATAANVGTATITATADRKSATHVIAVGVPFVPVESVALSESSLTLETGGTHSLTATVLPADATNKAVSWSSDNTAVATVDANGRVRAAAAGTATITVTTVDGGKTATCAVTVNGEPTPTPTPTPSGGSSGGCAAGIGATALLALLPFALRRRKK